MALFNVQNNFLLGNYNACIQEATDLEEVSDQLKIDRDCYVYRSYIALGSYEVRRVTQRDWNFAWGDERLLSLNSSSSVRSRTLLQQPSKQLSCLHNIYQERSRR